MIKKLTIIICAFWFLSLSAEAQVKLLKSEDNGVLLSCRFDSVSLNRNGLGQIIPALSGCQIDGEPGQPISLFQRVLVGIPPNARIEVKTLSVDYKEFTGIDLAPVPSLEPTAQNELGSYVYRKDDKYYKYNGFSPKDPALLHSIDILRQHRVALIQIHPIQYDPGSRKIRVYSRMQVQVTWDVPISPAAGKTDDVYGPILADQIINYDQSMNWTLETAKTSAKAEDPFANAPVWYRLSVVSQGIYMLDYKYLKRNGINPDIIDPQTIKIFNGGSKPYAKSYSPPIDSLKEMGILVKGEQDGRFDDGDQIVFFGQDLTGWDKNSALQNGHYYNPYGDTNSYWLCWGGANGKRMPERDCRPVSSIHTVPQSFSDTIHHEQDVFNPFNSGELWFWLNLKRMTGELRRDYVLEFDLPNAVQGQAMITINYRAGIGGKHHLNWGANGSLTNRRVWTGGPLSGPYTDSVITMSLTSAGNTLNMQLDSDSSDTMDIVYLNWFEVKCRRYYQSLNYNLRFRADSLLGQPYRFHLTGFGGDSVTILDISDPEAPVNLNSDHIYKAYAEFEDKWQKGRLYWAAASPGLKKPVKIEPYIPQNLRQKYLNVNYLVITADEFWPQAQALLAIHAGESRLQPAAAVKLSWIYNEFSFGLKDPSAIRRFLDYIYLNTGGGNPKRCLLFGDGSYDYREIDKTWGSHNRIPTHQDDELYYELGEYLFKSFDDWFVYLNGSYLPQFILARLPAKSSDEAWITVNKASSYKSAAGEAKWRNNIILTADDEFVSGNPYGSEAIHTADSEYLAQRVLPGSFNIKKVYGVMREYPTNSGYKPDAQDALLNYWNQGASIINYFGHGAWWVWGHEHYFLYTDVSKLANGDKLPLVIMGTCGTSRFDMNNSEAIGTSLVVRNGGGAIATVGATRGTYSAGNDTLVKLIYNGLFKKSYDIGQAVYNSKFTFNNPLYILMGDPGLYLSKPAGSCSLGMNADTLKSRGRYEVNGKIDSLPVSLNGLVLFTLYDIVRTDSSLYTPSLKFKIPGQPIINFTAYAVNGSFTAGFILPNMASLRAETLLGARIGAYAWGSNYDASGLLDKNLWIGGVDATPFSDTAKPLIELWANDVKLADGDPVGRSSRLAVKIQDDAGLNIIPFSAAQTDQVQLLIKDQELVNLSNNFVFDPGSVTSGQVFWTIPDNLAVGVNKLKYSAYDLTGKKGVLEINLNVIPSSGVNRIDGVYNYPNPFKNGTCFTFNLYQDGDVAIKIYTISGRTIKTLVQPGKNIGYNQVFWDGRDADGSLLANGVYFYKITIKGESGEASAMGKMVVMK